MGKTLLKYGNGILIACCLWLLLSIASQGFFWLYRDGEEVDLAKKEALPPGAFRQKPQAYQGLAALLEVEHHRPRMHLPDLAAHMMFLGTNQRPDENLEKPILYFSLKGQLQMASVAAHDPLYLSFDRKSAQTRYLFSPNNEPTSLWIEANPQGDTALIEVKMRDEMGEIVEEPEKNRQFTLALKEFARSGAGVRWEIGEWKVDPSLLIRQKAAWCGQDLFLRDFGGEAYAFTHGKERIDFGLKEQLYSCFVAVGDVMVFDEGRWKVVQPGPDSVGKPLMQVKSIEERLMRFELWDADGKAHVLLSLTHGRELWPDQSLLHFRYVGAKARNQAIVEVNGQRLHLRKGDWWFLANRLWKKLSAREDILAYVEGKIQSPLFIFSHIVRKGERQVLEGIVYDGTRSVAKKVEMSLEPLRAPTPLDTEPYEERSSAKPLKKGHISERSLERNGSVAE